MWLFLLVQITLTPGWVPREGETGHGVLQLCLLCGSRGTADAVLNTFLLLPLGLFLGLRWSAWVALGAGLLLSLGIELLQLSLPGRSSTLGDIVLNGLGAGLGAVIVIVLRRWLTPGARSRGAVPVAVGLPILYLLLAAEAVVPAGTEARYYGQWTPDLASMPQYQGTVLEAELDGGPVPPGAPYPDDSTPRAALAEDWVLRVRAVVGPPPASVSPVVSLYDENRQEILFLGIDRTHLVLRERRAGDALGLDRMDLRWHGALDGVSPGDTVMLEARRVGDERCLVVDGEPRCGLAFTPGRTWGLLLFLDGAGPLERTILGIQWMMTLWVLLGLLGGSPRVLALGTGAGALLMLLVTGVTGLLAPLPTEWLGMLLGIGVGVALRPPVRLFLGVELPPPAPPRGAAPTT